MEQAEVLQALCALANANRLEIVRLLVPRGSEGLAAGAIADALGISASALSFHLSALEQAGLLTSKRQGRQMIYHASHPALGATIDYLFNDCCAGHPKISTCGNSDD